MNIRKQARVLRATALLLLACGTLSGCLSMKMYVDPALPQVSKADLPVVPQPRPVQVLFEFDTKGNANATATGEIKPRVLAIAEQSGLFSSVSDTAMDGDAGVLKIVIDNVPVDKNAAAKGFGTGLTFGLAGTMVTDGYVCTASYTHDGHTTETTVKHAIYTTIGNHAAPQGLTPMQPVDAVHQVTDQFTWNALKQLADKQAFNQ
ncbi:MAG TPA: hypothetical protein VFH71_01085 [Rhodanobacteraceae bacterium]|nr:hypothetical protein [Rhodanobacteraceae bacterium]